MSHLSGNTEETPLQGCLKRMRSQIAKIEAHPVEAVRRDAMELRHQMIELVSLINALQTTAAARRMTGEAEPLKPQAPIDDTPLFVAAAAKAAPTAEDLERRILQARWREGDHTQDPQPKEEAA